MSSSADLSRIHDCTRCLAQVRDAFAAVAGAGPELVAFAPGRVNLIGEHTDYNGGFVLPMAIDRGIFIAARKRQDRTVRLWSAQFPGDCAVLNLDVGIERGDPAWSNYARGVLAGMLATGAELPGFDAFVCSSLPVGGGVSSSAALEVSMATLCEALGGLKLEPVQKALLCQRAEHEFAGVPCGIMDQFAVTMGREGHLLLIDCRSQAARHVPMRGPEVAILVINTMVRHALVDGGYKSRRDDCYEAARIMGVLDLRGATTGLVEACRGKMHGRLHRRARHVVTEDQRTLAAVAALEQGAWEELGQLMYASHDSLRDDFEVSCAELDIVVSAARDLGIAGGVYGCRMTGGGFGGCCVALVQTACAEVTAEKLLDTYHRRTGITAMAFTTRPSGGPQMLHPS